MNLVVVQAGRGVTIRAVSRGKVVDTVSLDAGTDFDSALLGIAKGIGAMFAAVDCDVEAIVLAGELLADEEGGKALRKRVGRLAPVMVFEGDAELQALAGKVREVLTGRA
jgi:butyrate kinase